MMMSEGTDLMKKLEEQAFKPNQKQKVINDLEFVLGQKAPEQFEPSEFPLGNLFKNAMDSTT